MKKIILLIGLFASTMIDAQNTDINYKNCSGCPVAATSNPSVSQALYTYGADTAYNMGNIESDFVTLFDSRYVHKLNYKNIATGITKYPDLVLVDIYGYLDFYELKKSGTKLLQYDKSHKTWYWSKDVSMVISQASDYLQKAKENALSYSQGIKTETETETEEGLKVSIINPRAIIVIGTNT